MTATVVSGEDHLDDYVACIVMQGSRTASRLSGGSTRTLRRSVGTPSALLCSGSHREGQISSRSLPRPRRLGCSAVRSHSGKDKHPRLNFYINTTYESITIFCQDRLETNVRRENSAKKNVSHSGSVNITMSTEVAEEGSIDYISNAGCANASSTADDDGTGGVLDCLYALSGSAATSAMPVAWNTNLGGFPATPDGADANAPPPYASPCFLRRPSSPASTTSWHLLLPLA